MWGGLAGVRKEVRRRGVEWIGKAKKENKSRRSMEVMVEAERDLEAALEEVHHPLLPFFISQKLGERGYFGGSQVFG